MHEALLMSHVGPQKHLVSLVGFVSEGPMLMLLVSYCEHGQLLQRTHAQTGTL